MISFYPPSPRAPFSLTHTHTHTHTRTKSVSDCERHFIKFICIHDMINTGNPVFWGFFCRSYYYFSRQPRARLLICGCFCCCCFFFCWGGGGVDKFLEYLSNELLGSEISTGPFHVLRSDKPSPTGTRIQKKPGEGTFTMFNVTSLDTAWRISKLWY